MQAYKFIAPLQASVWGWGWYYITVSHRLSKLQARGKRWLSSASVELESLVKMSFYEERGSSDMLDMSVTLGKSFDNGGGMVSPIRSSFHCLPEPPTPVFKTKLPPAVATVPPDHIRSYLHQKKVNHYLVGNKLGEGSFAKVKEAFHIMVGEKVSQK